MSKPISVPNIYAAQSGPLPLSTLDVNFATLGNAINDIATYSNYFADTGLVNAMVVTTTGLSWSNADGNLLQVKVGNTNTSATVTLNVNGAGALNVVNSDGSALFIGQLVANTRIIVICTGTVFQILSATYPKLLTVYKPALTSRSSTTTFTNDPDLAITLFAGTYLISSLVNFYSSGAGGGIKFTLAYSGAGLGPPFTGMILNQLNGTLSSVGESTVANVYLDSATISTNSSLPDFSRVETVATVTNSGVLSVQWAQHASSVNAANVMAGSYLSVQRIA